MWNQLFRLKESDLDDKKMRNLVRSIENFKDYGGDMALHFALALNDKEFVEYFKNLKDTDPLLLKNFNNLPPHITL